MQPAAPQSLHYVLRFSTFFTRPHTKHVCPFWPSPQNTFPSMILVNNQRLHRGSLNIDEFKYKLSQKSHFARYQATEDGPSI